MSDSGFQLSGQVRRVGWASPHSSNKAKKLAKWKPDQNPTDDDSASHSFSEWHSSQQNEETVGLIHSQDFLLAFLKNNLFGIFQCKGSEGVRQEENGDSS